MPSSSGKKHKHPQHSKKSKAIQRQRSVVTPTSSPAAAVQPVHQSAEVEAPQVPVAAAPQQTRPAAVMEYPYLASELKRVGILAAVIIIILIVLAIVLG